MINTSTQPGVAITARTQGLPPGQTSAALDGVDFRTGGRYLIASTNGIVNGCGFSGEATPELEAAYAEAFPT